MKNAVVVLFALVLICTHCFASPTPLPTATESERQVQKVNSDFFQAISNRNIDRFDQIVADDAIFPVAGTNNDSFVTKQIVRDGLVSVSPHVEIKNVKVTATRVYDNTAVVMGRLWAPSKYSNGHRAFTNIFVRTKESDWKLISSGHYEVTKSQ